MTALEQLYTRLPKAELHVHLEGSIEPPTVVELAARHGVKLTLDDVAARYAPGDFAHFIESFKWVTSFLREPADYALLARRFAETLRSQNVLYAEVTLSVGVMYFREQDPEANFVAMREAAASVPGVRIAWIFDAVRQWGVNAAMNVARIAVSLRSPDIIAYGIGGDELALPARELRRVYDYVGAAGLHRLLHVGETGEPAAVREAVEALGVERIGHGIAAMRDESVMDFLTERGIPLEVCPTSNIRTGSLAFQLGRTAATFEDHPLAAFYRRGVPVTLSSDDPAIFGTSLSREYVECHRLGLAEADLLRIAEAGFHHAFLSPPEKAGLLEQFRSGARDLGLL